MEREPEPESSAKESALDEPESYANPGKDCSQVTLSTFSIRKITQAALQRLDWRKSK